jgi:hypothetical protein
VSFWLFEPGATTKLNFVEKWLICASPLAAWHLFVAKDKFSALLKNPPAEEITVTIVAAVLWHGFTLLPLHIQRSLTLMILSGLGVGLFATINPFGIGLGTFILMGAWLLYRHWNMRPPVGKGPADPVG